MKKTERLEAWLKAGMPDDAESLDKFGIGMAELKKLEKRVMRAVHDKMTQRPDVFTFAEHRTLQ